MTRSITLACAVYDRTFGLADGTVTADGLAIRFIALPHGDLFRRQARHREFDVAEFSLATYAMLRSRGDDGLIAIPVFPSRMFRHSSVYMNASSPLSPGDLAGRRVGTQEYQQTAGVWVRGILADEYGVRPDHVCWVLGAYDEPGTFAIRIALELPASIRTETIPSFESLAGLLARGEIAALLGARPPRSFAEGRGVIARMFPDYEEIERDYFQRTGIFPIMHTVVLRRELYEDAPWTAMSLYQAFLRAKALGARRLADGGSSFAMLPWLARHVADARALMGDDPYAYGVAPNRAVLERFLRYCGEQGLLARSLTVPELFARETLDAPSVLVE